ncbi:hypothetical protein [Alcanivorax sp. S71-1-4]|uniref:hypothetical protein n=1 Tax=Alcanivorax sp. S71-1-4 TaxID=1177159 RepID=UPI0013576F5B|nr:hypothetical protein [Alcanivorax sp. S71-1-4]
MATLLAGNVAMASLLGAGMFVATPEVTPVMSQGYVMARAQVVGPNGGPILIKARIQGNAVTAETTEVEEIGEVVAGGHLDGSYILSGDEYREVLSRWATLRATQPELASRAEFTTRDRLAQGLKLANGDMSEPLTLPTHLHTVVVLGEEDRFGQDTRRHVLIAAPFLFDRDTTLEDGVSSLLMDADGNLLDTAQGSGVGSGDFDVEVFTYRTAFYAEPGGTEQSEQRLQEGDEIFGPVANATIEQLGWYGPSYALTGSDGRYTVNAPMLCMRTGWGYYLVPGIEFPLTLTVPTVPFNPNRLGIPPYYELRTVYAACGDAGYRPNRFDFLIDVLWLVGEMHLANTPGGAPIPVGETVTYEGENREGDPTTQEWDFDGDGENDTVLLADKVTETDDDTGMDYTVPQENEEGAWQAVYFSSGSRSPEAEILAERVPDLWRLADRSLDQRATGILTGISEDALRHTDVYIFRESTGELLVEVSGLPDGPYAGRASRVENNRYLWHTLLRGAESRRNSYAAYGQSGITGAPDEEQFSAESEELGFSSRYQAREVDLPAPGESLYLVAINRVTGYTGSLRFELGRPGAGDGGARQNVPELALLPPNVKVWAQRLTEIEAGLTQGEEREYLISHEGAATSSDIIVGLYTEWLAPDGSPMPAALGTNRGEDYGLTGRLAKVVDGNLVAVSAGQAVEDTVSLEEALTAGSAGNVAEFGIGPGRQLQLLRLPEFGQGNEHYYLNIFGRALNKEVCSHCQYDQSGAHPTLAGRPNHFAPLYVPRYDEATTLALRADARKLAHEQEEEAKEIAPQYLWVVRPEYQFSQLDFRVDEILGSYEDENGEKQSRNLLDNRAPIISCPDELIDLVDELTLPGQDSLPGFDGDRQYVIAIGETEFLLDPGAPEPIRLEQLAHLIQLANLTTAEDFLTIRLFLHHDPANLLWEWAFGTNGLQVVFEYPGGELLVTPEVEEEGGEEIDLLRLLGGARLHYRFNFPNGAQPQSMKMWINASGRICPSLATASDECTTVSAGAGPVTEVLLQEWGPEDASLSDTHPRWGLYWEPESWELGLDARLRVEVSYWAGDQLVQYSDEPVPGFEEQTHEPIVAYVRNRPLGPDEDVPMHGTDVAMLETMLWQLGVSPQRGGDYRARSNAGSEGARLASNRSGTGPSNTQTCQGQPANRRDTFYTGWGANCASGRVSLEGMVRRFRGRNEATGDGVPFDPHYGGDVIRSSQGNEVVSGDPVSGLVDDDFLAHLQRVWPDYLNAYDAFPGQGVVGFSSLGMEGWIASGMALWESGDPSANIVPTYTNAEHQAALLSQGEQVTDAISRAALFRAWKAQEAPYHWGSNTRSYQSTPYRITEGGGDEVGSLGFSQIKYAYRYGDSSLRCNALENYNLYSPAEAILGMIAFVSASPSAGNQNCTKSFYFGFAEQGRWRTLTNARGALRGYLDSTGGLVAIAEGRVDDAYERLMKSLAGYNGMTSLQSTSDRVWAHVLRVAHTTAMGNAISNRLYAMDIRQRFGLEGRSYVWFGGRWPEDATVEDGEGNVIPHPEAGQDWCFVYGESEWQNADNHPITGAPMGFNDYRDQAEQQAERRVSCN